MSGESSVTQLKSMNKVDGTKYIEWQRSTRAIISLTHPGIADIINGVQRPVEIFEDVYEEDPQQPASTACLLYTSPSPRDLSTSRMPSSA